MVLAGLVVVHRYRAWAAKCLYHSATSDSVLLHLRGGVVYTCQRHVAKDCSRSSCCVFGSLPLSNLGLLKRFLSCLGLCTICFMPHEFWHAAAAHSTDEGFERMIVSCNKLAVRIIADARLIATCEHMYTAAVTILKHHVLLPCKSCQSPTHF